mmetsp:Transcript_11009/g.17656  ORF Transcript_11009/g.17656 Transcript_11009/m.17656 type:complete len:242 (-) Transcript_11009:128-853(-)
MANSRRPADEHTRTRLLNRLGLFKTPPSSAVRRSYPSTLSSKQVDPRTTVHPLVLRHNGQNRRKSSVLGEVNPTVTKLKEEPGQEKRNNDDTLASAASDLRTTSCNACTKYSKGHSVKFDEKVSVVSIPSRYQYSKRIKGVLWSSKDELAEMAERNIIEYEYEGWDYNNVVLDEEMYVDSATGSLVHPCHFHFAEDGHAIYYAEKGTEEDGNNNKEDDEDEEEDDSYFRPLERQSSVATSQ